MPREVNLVGDRRLTFKVYALFIYIYFYISILSCEVFELVDLASKNLKKKKNLASFFFH